MKENLITAIISCLITSYVWAEVIPREKEIEFVKVVEVEKYKVDKHKLAEAFAYVESGNNPKAVNKHTKATGVLQIMPIMVEEANRLAGYKKYKLSDRTDKDKSFELFHLIMQHKNPEYDIALACYIWNPNGKVKYVRDIENKYNEFADIFYKSIKESTNINIPANLTNMLKIENEAIKKMFKIK